MWSGGRPPFCAVIFAPIISSGAIIRAMGRRESDSSPVSWLLKSCPARMPLNIRIVEPELPQSRGEAGGCSFRAPAVNDHAVLAALHLDAQSSYTAQRAGAVRAGREILQSRIALSDGGEHGIAVRNRLVPRQPQRS